jgi:uncharacterized membrane-anchored protein YitT (DUF2179 family)
MDQNKKRTMISNILLIITGNIILAAASAFFLVPLQIVNGGMNGIALIFEASFGWEIDITTAILSCLFFALGFVLLGKQFTFKTILATITYPLFIFLFLRLIGPQAIGFDVLNDTHRLLASIFGGALIGFGIGLTFLAGGSTGGFDVLLLALKKYFDIKPSFSSLVFDAIIIAGGMFTFGVISGFYGILSTIVTSLMIELIFLGFSQTYFVTIISKKYETINQFILDRLERGSTIIPARGGFSDQPINLIQVGINRSEYFLLKQYISELDPQAFVVFAHVRSINGLGFDPFPIDPRKILKQRLKK